MGFGYAIYFPERPRNRVVRWDPDSGDVDIVAGEPKDGDPTQILVDPYGVTFDKDRTLIVSDKYRLCRLRKGRLETIQLRDVDGHRARTKDSDPMYDPSRLYCPTTVIREKEGSLVCTFSEDRTIYRIHADGRLELILGRVKNRPCAIRAPREYVPPEEALNVPLDDPTGVVKKADGTFYFIERQPQIVRRYHPREGLRSLFPLSMSDRWVRRHEAPERGSINDYHPAFPASLALDADDYLYVCDPIHSGVLRIDEDAGAFHRVIRVAHGIFFDRGPVALAFGADGTAWVMDSMSGGLQAYGLKSKTSWSPLDSRLTQIRGVPMRFTPGGMGMVVDK